MMLEQYVSEQQIPEDALNRLTDEFVKRFEAVEKKVSAEGRDVVRMSLAEIEELGDELEG